MDAETFLENFSTIAEAPGGVSRLRDLVLELAVSGRLVKQDPLDAPIAALLAEAATRRRSMIAEGIINKPRYPEAVPVEDAPFEVPPSWAWVRLGDVGAIVGGGTPRSDEPAYWSDGDEVPWLTPADMRSQASRMVDRGSRDITAVGLAESSAQLLPAGSVLFSSRAPIGHVGIAARPLATNQGFKSCVPYLAAMSEYLYLYLRQVGPSVDAAATGTTFKEVSGRDVALMPVSVPPVAEQHRIVVRVEELLARCDDLAIRIERRRLATVRFRSSVLQALREPEDSNDLRRAWERAHTNWTALADDTEAAAALRPTVLQLAVEGRVVDQDSAEGTASELLEEIRAEKVARAPASRRRYPAAYPPVGSPPFRVPERWLWAPLGDLALEMRYGSSAKSEPSGDVPVLRMGNLQSGAIDWSDLKYTTDAKEIKSYALPSTAVLFNRTNSPELVGKTAIYRGERPALFAGYLIHIRESCGLDPEFLNLVLNSPFARGWCRQVKTDGISQSNISASKLALFPFPLPPLAEQRRIVERASVLLARCAELGRAVDARAQRGAALVAAPILPA